MLQSINQAWHELSQGNEAAAEQVFQAYLNDQPNSTEALRGLACVALHRGAIEEAESLARRGLAIDNTADLQLLLGEILGSQGRRREAEQFLAHAVQLHSSDPYARALLGEQKIRQGRWNDGVNDFIEALSDDADGDAFRHSQGVVADLVDAHAAGRIPEKDAMKFVNRLDYSVPKSAPEMQAFFAAARRAIHSRQALPQARRAQEKALPAAVRRGIRNHSGGAQPAADARRGIPSAYSGLSSIQAARLAAGVVFSHVRRRSRQSAGFAGAH